MPDEKPNKYEPLPIPTYEEAINGSSSRAATPRVADNVRETAHPAEREGLLGGADTGGRVPIPTRRAGYRPPPTPGHQGNDDENATFLGQEEGGVRRHSEESETDMVREEMEEMEMEEPRTPGRQSAWGKRISSISQSLSSLTPFKWKWKPRLPFKLKLSWPTIDANFCIVLGRCFAILLVMAVVYLLFMSDIFTSAAQRMGGQMFDPESVRIHVQNMVNEEKIKEYLRIVTENDHVAGTEGDYVLAEYVQKFFRANFLEDVRMDQYDVYLNYPKVGGRKVEILAADGTVSWRSGIRGSAESPNTSFPWT